MNSYDAEFIGQITSAYHALYDLVALRSHPLAVLLVNAADVSAREQGWQLHNLLIDAVHQLDPGPQAPMYSKEWRRYQLMLLRYIDGLDPQAVAEQLAISRRQFYREHSAAMAASAEILRARLPHPTDAGNAPEASAAPNLLRSEFDRISGQEQTTRLADVMDGVWQLLAKLVHEQRIQVESDIPADLLLSVNASLMRQLLLAVLGAVATHCHDITLRLTVVNEASTVRLELAITPPALAVAAAVRAQLAPYGDVLQSSGITVEGLEEHDPLAQFALLLPALLAQSVLVIDDNQDVLELYDRYLTPNGYQVIATSDAEAALDLAARLQPSVIIIDLMMPQTDGWELLRRLRLHPTAAVIPVIICSVLKQRALALALGAQDYIEKPITEQRLLAALSAILDETD